VFGGVRFWNARLPPFVCSRERIYQKKKNEANLVIAIVFLVCLF